MQNILNCISIWEASIVYYPIVILYIPQAVEDYANQVNRGYGLVILLQTRGNFC